MKQLLYHHISSWSSTIVSKTNCKVLLRMTLSLYYWLVVGRTQTHLGALSKLNLKTSQLRGGDSHGDKFTIVLHRIGKCRICRP